ncbi:MAG: GDP-mannose 4,6-dehydratase, partial [Candidatus Aenigmarchaeota archaeon]|nr:GDP-mannose 4,6-dehydratase [Candidatus Aenigmarchaeota archaeon]
SMLFNVLEFCRAAGIKRLMFASSREVYGNTVKIYRNEKDVQLGGCESPYSASKMGGEAFVSAYQKCYGIDYAIIRFSNVYGMYDDSERVVPLFIRLTRQGKDLTVFGKDKMLDFTYIDDAIAGVMKCVEGFEKAKNDVYNISSTRGTSITYLAEAIQKEMKAANKIVVQEPRTGEVIRFIGDITNAKNKLGYEPKVEIGEGIRKSIVWYSKNVRD